MSRYSYLFNKSRCFILRTLYAPFPNRDSKNSLKAYVRDRVDMKLYLDSSIVSERKLIINCYMQKIAIVAVLIKIFFRDRDQKTPQFDESKKLPRHVVRSRQ